MRDRERGRIMERMIQRERERDRITSRTRARHSRWRREKNLILKMGFVTLNPLNMTIYYLLNASHPISIDSRSRGFLKFAEYGLKEALQLLKSLQEFGDCVESKRVNALEAQITEAAFKLEDVLDSYVSDQFLSQSESPANSLNLEEIEEDIDAFVLKMVEMDKLLDPWPWYEEEEEEEGEGGECGPSVSRSEFMSWFATKAASVFLGIKEDYIQDIENLLPQDQGHDDDYARLFTSAFPRSKPENQDRLGKIKDELIIWWLNKAAASIFVEEEEEEQLDSPLPEAAAAAVSSTTGYALNVSNMVGSTDLFFEIRNNLLGDGSRMGSIVGMAGIGKTALAKKILQDPLISTKFECCIFVTMGPKYDPKEILQAILAQMPDGDKMQMAGLEDMAEYLYQTLEVKRYLIVLDDAWDRELWYSSIFRKLYPIGGDSCVLVTTRINKVAHYDRRIYQVPFLNKEESWDLLRGKIFGEKERCPHQLVEAGKKIAENCEGLPLLILTVADLLSKAEITPEHWKQVAANKTNSTFIEAYEQILEVVRPSYSYLPLRLKACFLYFGAFPQNDEVRSSKLLSLWSADGFLGVTHNTLQMYIGDLLNGLVSDNVALGSQMSCIFNKLKACSLHSVFWYLCKREAWNEKFLLVLNSYKDARAEGIQSARRLSIYKNSILSIKDVRDSIASMPGVRSLLCTGPYHQYQVPICFGLRLLKVLYALTIRFYEFPQEVLRLLQLRYLTLTCNENLPSSISKLWSLRFLLVHPHQSIRSSVSESYLPVEIWDLKELEHLQIMGRNLPDPPPGTVLPNLLELLDVGAHTCTERVLGSIPKLEKLRVQIELMPGSAEPLIFCDDISHLQGLRSVQFVVVNPELMFAPAPLFSFPLLLRKLTLSGFGYPWEDMNQIAQLPCLEVLKLKCYAFQGEEWQVKEGEFRKLRYLSIEDTDLVKWTGALPPELEKLTIKNCYKLQEIPDLPYKLQEIPDLPFWYNSCEREIRLVDCNPSAVACAKQMADINCSVSVESSFYG